MSLNMYLGEVQNQTQSMNAVCAATIQGMEQAIQSIDAFAVDTVLQGQTYSSAKSFFVQTFRPLAQGIIYLCEELIRQNNAFPSQFQSQVASTDVIEQEIREQIQEINQSIASIEMMNAVTPMPGIDALVAVLVEMRKKLEEKLEHLYEFNYTSSSNYDTALQLASSIAIGLAEVQSGKGFSPASGTFSTQGLNMEWTTSIQAITEERARQAANSIEEGEMCGKLPEKSTGEKIWDGIVDGTGQAVSDTIDGIKALGDWETWENMGNAALHPIDTLSTMYNVLSDSFINDVINGDAESRAKWGSYALTQVGLGLIGDKGLSKVSKVATTANLTKGMSRVTNSAKYRNAINVLNNFNLNIGNRFAYAGIGGSSLKSSFIDTYQTAKDKLSPYQYTKRTTDGDVFVGKLYGEDVILKDVKVDEITYSKRTREEAEQLRKEFDRSVRKDFLNALVNDPVKLKELKKAGITDADIERMKRGNNPKGWQVHHNLPLDDGGTNDFGNLTLIQNHPYHKAITNTQRTLTRHLQEGDSVDVSWPIPKHNIYPKGE
ncbi:cytoplasmic protein [Bacillus cereus]|uniref:Ribonuclease n=1 Tax=Bacillus paranthracis TaxID=2026186 RepID=A0A9X8SDW7_9BACI|nr:MULTISPECIES: T7SS effector LXG polymorphic toxin [Bacillus cereus group]ONG79368.1 cytoplasmic protein [Bacillus cereus]MDA1986247.1 T7SS effector LXG polymorphic toxin [Bacillus cereus group sp. BcHK104]MDA2238583.1 T7SS effector LXG polymorphic toxin [Bacillus cereus group sp. Bc222]MDA2584023.1 T7SS effector LXG polymorphic toxin [Bacillus cereus group sp. Bc062]MDX6044466.1 T7SS effector LXG polymorphic toxin [Bacillus paranthracis]